MDGCLSRDGVSLGRVSAAAAGRDFQGGAAAAGSGSGGLVVLIPRLPIKVSQAERLTGALGGSGELDCGTSKPGTVGSVLRTSAISRSGSAAGAATCRMTGGVTGAEGSSSLSSPHMLERRRGASAAAGGADREKLAGGLGWAGVSLAMLDSALGKLGISLATLGTSFAKPGVTALGSAGSGAASSDAGGSAGPGIPNWLSSIFQLSDILLLMR